MQAMVSGVLVIAAFAVVVAAAGIVAVRLYRASGTGRTAGPDGPGRAGGSSDA